MLVLPDNYRVEVEDGSRSPRCLRLADVRAQGMRVLRIGIVNVMPKAESYEPYLLRPLAYAPVPVEPVWIRLESHGYASSSPAHIQQHYRTFAQALGEGALSGLILSGAPVEELAFEAVHYWPELSGILDFSRRNLNGTLGLCWGGLALAKMVGLEKVQFQKKLFGVFQNRSLVRDHEITGNFDDTFSCAHSRHSGIAYEASRLVHEWQRDRALGRTDVELPSNFDPENPSNVWRSHCNELFSQWLQFLAE